MLDTHKVAKYNMHEVKTSREQIFAKDSAQLETFIDVQH